MKIKIGHRPSFMSDLFLLLGALGILILVVAFLSKKPFSSSPKNISTGTLPTSTVDFMKEKTSLFGLLNFFHDHTILLAVKDEASSKLSPETRKKLAKIGGKKLSKLAFRESYVGLFRNGKILEEVSSKTDSVSLTFDRGKVYSASNLSGNFAKFDLDDQSWHGNGRGLNAFVISKTGELLGIWSFDFFSQNNPLARTERYVPDFFKHVEFVELEIKEEHFAKLKKKRDEAMQTKLLLTEDDDLVPTRIIFRGERMKGDIRLKGDWVDHLDGDNWSFRVKLNKENTLMGMRKFSLHRPETRNYVGEWLFHKLLRDADILNLQYHFVQVKLTIRAADGTTEKMLGLYALEEFFDKHLIERERRREGVILKVDESAIWDERASFFRQGIELNEIGPSSVAKYDNLPVLPFGKSQIVKDSSLLRQFNTGAALFSDFLTAKRPIHEVFDVERLANFTAICNLLGANHALVPHNIRVYFNPVTSRLEPIGFDGNSWRNTGYFSGYFRTSNDPVYQAAYLGALEKITETGYLEKIMNWPGLKDKMELMSLAYPELEHSFETLNTNRGLIRNSIFPTQSLKVFFEKLEGDFLHLTIENYGRFPVEIMGIENEKGRRLGQPTNGSVILKKERQHIAIKLDENFERLFIQKGKKKSNFDPKSDLPQLRLGYKTLGTSILHREIIYPWTEIKESFTIENPVLSKPNADEYDFLIFDETEKTITCKPGHWRLGSSLIIPAGYSFRAGPDTRIELINFSGKIISQSPLEFVGTADSPIEIFSGSKQGLGIFVFNTSDTSRFEYCHFNHLSNPETQGWALSGAVNFYEAPVSMHHCRFSENRCEDALNIFRSWFELENVNFTGIHADAFDGDFVEGTVRNCQFARVGNDAIDVSGSNILVENVSIIAAGDKGLSAGEGSQMVTKNIAIKNSAVALASKDQSILTIEKAIIENNELAFTAFQKKPEYGPAKIEASDVSLSTNQLEYLIETGSSLFLNGQIMPTEDDVIERMYGKEFGKKSGL